MSTMSTGSQLLMVFCFFVGGSVFAKGPAKDGSEVEALKFVSLMTETVKTGNPEKIGTLFQDPFELIGCNENYTREDVINRLSGSFPHFSMRFMISQWLDKKKAILFSTGLVGLKKEKIKAYLKITMINKKYVIVWGMISRSWCKETGTPSPTVRRFASIGEQSEGSKVKTEEFVTSLKRAIQSGESSEIASLFSTYFVLKGCKGDHRKNDVVSLLGKFSNKANISFTVQGSLLIDGSTDIAFSVLAENFVALPVKVYLLIIMEEGKYVLGRGKLSEKACSNPQIF